MAGTELKDLINERYKSVKEFALLVKIPYTTLDSILKRGVDKTSVVNVVKICKELNIQIDALIEGKVKEVVSSGHHLTRTAVMVGEAYDKTTEKEQSIVRAALDIRAE